MTPEEVWGEAKEASASRYSECFREGLKGGWLDEADQAAISVIRTAMEAYAAEKVAEERAAIVEWLNEQWNGRLQSSVFLAQAIAANQHHGGNDADT